MKIELSFNSLILDFKTTVRAAEKRLFKIGPLQCSEKIENLFPWQRAMKAIEKKNKKSKCRGIPSEQSKRKAIVLLQIKETSRNYFKKSQ